MKPSITELFEKHDKEFLYFDRVENKTSNRKDLHAFNLLDRLVPGSWDIVEDAQHDEIFLSVTVEELEEVATESDIIELIRCGVMYYESNDSLSMFV
jgi:hypothetical protein